MVFEPYLVLKQSIFRKQRILATQNKVLVFSSNVHHFSCETSGGRRDVDWIQFYFLLTGYTGLTGFFSPSARSPFGRRPFYPDYPVDPVQFSFKDENPFLFLSFETSSMYMILEPVNRGYKSLPRPKANRRISNIE